MDRKEFGNFEEVKMNAQIKIGGRFWGNLNKFDLDKQKLKVKLYTLPYGMDFDVTDPHGTTETYFVPYVQIGAIKRKK